MEIKEKINILSWRLESVYQMLKLMDEYNRNAEELTYTDYGYYFEIMYSYIKRYVVLEFYRINDNSGSDCISINKLKNDFIKNFDNYVSGKSCISQQEMRSRFSQIFSKKIREIENKIGIVRNKEGLAHGQEESFGIVPTIAELEELKIAYRDFLWLLCDVMGEERVSFGEGLVKTYELSDLVKILPHYDKKRKSVFGYMKNKGE